MERKCERQNKREEEENSVKCFLGINSITEHCLKNIDSAFTMTELSAHSQP